MARLALKRQRVQAVLSGVSALVTKRSADIQGFALNRRTSGRLGMDGLRGALWNVMRLCTMVPRYLFVLVMLRIVLVVASPLLRAMAS